MDESRREVLIGFDLGTEFVDRLAKRFPQVYFRYAPLHSREEMETQLGNAEVLCAYQVPKNFAYFPKLRWVQLTGAGYNHVEIEAFKQADVRLSNASLFAQPIAEYVLWSMLALGRRLYRFANEFQDSREWPTDAWRSHSASELGGRTVGIVGYGEIGQGIAKLALAFGMRVMATRQSATEPYEENGVTVLPAAQLPTLLGKSDFVVLSLPLSASSHHLIDAGALAQMKRSAYLINIARGAVVDEAAMIDALQRDELAGASLDVFETEPLASSSPLFELAKTKNVILTPHISGMTLAYYERMTEHIAENLRRYLAGQLLNGAIV